MNHNGKQNGIKNLCGLYWEFVDGLENRSGKIYVYDENNEDYIDSGIDLSQDTGYDIQIIDIFNTTQNILNEGIPSIRNRNGYIPSNLNEDRFRNNNGNNILLRGSTFVDNLKYGLWTFHISFGGTASDVGFRLSKDLI